MSTPNPIEVAAAPSLILMLQAVQQFIADMGPNPTAWALNFPGAQLKLTGTIALQFPALATAEAGAAGAAVNAQIAAWIAQLQKVSKPAT